jgi:hypothetical protein
MAPLGPGQRARWGLGPSLLPFALLVWTGCAASLGPTVGRTLSSDGATSAGGRLSERMYVWGDDGLVLGLDEEVLSRTDRGSCCDQWRVQAMGGFANLPLAYESRIGFEGGGLIGVGRIPVGDTPRYSFAPYLGGIAALPIRISRTKMPWNADDLVSDDWAIVPDITIAHFVPTEPEVDHSIRNEVSLGLALRVHLYSGALP